MTCPDDKESYDYANDATAYSEIDKGQHIAISPAHCSCLPQGVIPSNTYLNTIVLRLVACLPIAIIGTKAADVYDIIRHAD
jgi:hypothetical protein